eukprot:5973276-Pyramimonas_sp.AAC.1
MHKPSLKTVLAVQFNERGQADPFFFFEKVWLLMIDECIRHRIAAPISSKTGPDILRAMLSQWVRYFGPMDMLAMDQESGMTTDM